MNRHPPTWREKIPLEDTSLERPVRRMLERLSRKYWFNWKSSDGRCDFWIENVPIEVQGPLHGDEYPTQQKHDEFKRRKLHETGFPDPVYIEGEDIKNKPDEVFKTLEDLIIKTGGYLKEGP